MHPARSAGALPVLLTVATVAAVSLAAQGRQAPPPALQSYVLTAPDLALTLPPQLTEVSGVTALTDAEVACVQDEEGAVFLYDLQQRRVTRRIPFGPPGDYEDVARVGATLFVLRSDGTLFEVRDFAGAPRVTVHRNRLPTADNEGLALDTSGKRLLIAAKSRLAKGKAGKDERGIFAFDLSTAAARTAPVLILDAGAVQAFANDRGRQPPSGEKKQGGKKGPSLRFMPSAVAVHPRTSELFVLSAVDQVLATFDATGRVTGVAMLAPASFRQPEGITFTPGGALVLTNEGAGRAATLLVFKQRVR